ncbi:MAG: zinc ribbon domain-containing protein [Eubacteriales Family XIII. Incertae Sedis bacterium]|nr:MAG: zinc ribbon domain-containing protein [Clostridiales Family XIII bacterium]
MAFCKNCGKEIDDNAVVCPHCGVIQKEELVQNTVDNGGFLWGLLGCCIPIVGLILFLVWRDTKPKTSRAAGIGALVGVICVAVYYIVIIVIGVGLGVAGI